MTKSRGGGKDDAAMTMETGQFSPDGVVNAAETLGYRYRDLAFSCSLGDRGTPIFEGSLGFEALPSGISLCISDLRCLYDSEHKGMAERSIAIAIALDGDAADFCFGRDTATSISPSRAMILGIPDSTTITAHYTAGQRSRALLVRTRPEDFADAGIAEQIAALLHMTSVTPMPVSRRLLPLIEELATPSADGTLGRLLMDGCAQALLAHALLTLGQGTPPPASTPALTHRDYVKVTQVRDQLLANPQADFTLEALARDAGMSMTVLKEKFSAVFGQSVFSFLRDARLHHAKAGLETKGWTVSQAAYFVGYRHHSNFSTAFRRKFGAAPRSFVKR